MGPFPLRRSGFPELRGADNRRLAIWKSSQRSHLIILGLLAIALLLAACSPDAKQSTFGTAGPVAEKQLLLFNVLLWTMVVVFVLVEGALLYSLIRYRRRPGQGLPAQTHGNTALEITWTIIPTILVMGLGIWSVLTIFELDQPPASAENVLDVTVTGHQWWWEFDYLNADGSVFITTANELRIPVGRAVRLLLNSDDVIHSFWVPKLAGKVDVVPTRNNRMWIQADETGNYYGQCAEFCGVAHALMRFRVEVLTEPEYAAWVASYGQPLQLSSEAQRGQQVFNGSGGCVVCHTVGGSDAPATQRARMDGYLGGGPIFPGPNLTDLATRGTFAAGLLDLNRENLRRWLRNPNDVKPGNHMAELAQVYDTTGGNISLSDQDVTALIEYLLVLK